MAVSASSHQGSLRKARHDDRVAIHGVTSGLDRVALRAWARLERLFDERGGVRLIGLELLGLHGVSSLPKRPI
jgi:hypothetical protein